MLIIIQSYVKSYNEIDDMLQKDENQIHQPAQISKLHLQIVIIV